MAHAENSYKIEDSPEDREALLGLLRASKTPLSLALRVRIRSGKYRRQDGRGTGRFLKCEHGDGAEVAKPIPARWLGGAVRLASKRSPHQADGTGHEASP